MKRGDRSSCSGRDGAGRRRGSRPTSWMRLVDLSHPIEDLPRQIVCIAMFMHQWCDQGCGGPGRPMVDKSPGLSETNAPGVVAVGGRQEQVTSSSSPTY